MLRIESIYFSIKPTFKTDTPDDVSKNSSFFCIQFMTQSFIPKT